MLEFLSDISNLLFSLVLLVIFLIRNELKTLLKWKVKNWFANKIISEEIKYESKRIKLRNEFLLCGMNSIELKDDFSNIFEVSERSNNFQRSEKVINEIKKSFAKTLAEGKRIHFSNKSRQILTKG